MEMVDASLVFDAVMAVSIAAGAFFAVLELRSISRDRKTDLIMRCMGTFCNREFEQALSKIMSSTATDPEVLEREVSSADLALVCDFSESIAYLARRNLVDRKVVIDFIPFHYTWKKLRLWVVAFRERTGVSALYSDFEWLAKLQESPS
jgi:hypothetical protein